MISRLNSMRMRCRFPLRSVFRSLRHRYGDREALCGIDFAVATGEVFGLLGPNGGGKSTLFRLLATLLPIQSGSVALLGSGCRAQPEAAIRPPIGVTFQSPSVDGKLTVAENLRYQANLYGLSGPSGHDAN